MMRLNLITSIVASIIMQFSVRNRPYGWVEFSLWALVGKGSPVVAIPFAVTSQHLHVVRISFVLSLLSDEPL